MGTEQDVKEAFSDRPRESEMLGQPSVPHAQFVVADQPTTWISKTGPARPLTTVYGTAPHLGEATYVGDVKYSQTMVISPVSTSSSSKQVNYICTSQEEDMDVAQSLTELARGKDIQYPPQASRLLVITQDEDGEIEIVQNQNVTLEKGEEKLLKKIAKTASVRPLKSDKDAAYASLDTEISGYLVKYEDEEATKKITMRDLRHVIPLLIMRCYAVSDEPYQRKVRGMWTDRPPNWPNEIPYCDPNNKKDSGKPKKNTLLQMFMYLKSVYTSNHRDVLDRYKSRRAASAAASLSSPSSRTPPVPSIPSPPAMEDMETVTASTAAMPAGGVPSTALEHPYHPLQAGLGRGVTAALPPGLTTSRALRDHNAPSPSLSPPGGQQPQAGPPQQTVLVASFSEIDQDWEPEGEIVQRIDKKMAIIGVYDRLQDDERQMVRLIRDIIFNMYQVRSQDHLFFLEIAHEFEATLDVIKITSTLPEKTLNRWRDFYERNHEVPDVAASEQVLDITEDTVACEPLGLGREEEVITDCNIVVSTEDNPNTAKASSGASDDIPETPAHYLQTFSQELEQSEHTTYLSPDLNTSLSQDNLFENVEPEDKRVIDIAGSGDGGEQADESEHKESETSELANLLTVSLQMTEDMHYADPQKGASSSSTPQVPPPSSLFQAPLSSNLSQVIPTSDHSKQTTPSNLLQAPNSGLSTLPLFSSFTQIPLPSSLSQAPPSVLSSHTLFSTQTQPSFVFSQALPSTHHSKVPPSSCLSAPPTDKVDLLPDAHDEKVFPLSSSAGDLITESLLYNEFFINSDDRPPSAPSTNIVSTTMAMAPGNVAIIQQEQSHSHIPLVKIKEISEKKDSSEKEKSIKSMAQAFHSFKKQNKNMQFQGESCQSINSVYNTIIPVVVEDMEKEIPGNRSEPDRKKRKLLKRPFPSSEITIE